MNLLLRHRNRARSGPVTVAGTVLLCLVACLLGGRAAFADTYVVNSLEDDGPGSFRQAIVNANAHVGPDTITFALPAGGIDGVRILAPLTPLPPLTDPGTTIDATTQAGYATVHLPRVELNGTAGSLTDAIGLTIAASNCAVKGLCVNRCGKIGIYLTAAAISARIEDCFLGTDAFGETALGSTVGVQSDGASGVAIRRCLISGNAIGAAIYNSASGIIMENCLIGTDVSGDDPLGNQAGIVLYGAPGATIRNCYIGANSMLGIYVGPGSDSAAITGNVFGVGTFMSVLGNDGDALVFDDAAKGLVQNCLFAFSSLSGIHLTGAKTTGTNVQSSSFYLDFAGVTVDNGANGNTLGWTTTATGLICSGNSTNGITITDTAGAGNRLLNSESSQNLYNGVGVYASDQTISGCRFSRNLAEGVSVSAVNGKPYAERIVITKSGFLENGDMGIRLDSNIGGVGVGGNRLTPAPKLSAAYVGGGVVVVQGTLAAKPSTRYTIEIFASGTSDTAGLQQGERYLGSFAAQTGTSGLASYIGTIVAYASKSEIVSLTATGPDGTSVFCGGVTPKLIPAPTLTSLTPSSTVAGSAAFTLTVQGINYVPTSVVRWNGIALKTTYLNVTNKLTALITGDLIAAPGTAAVTVSTPSPGGGQSAPLTFTITNPVPTLNSLSPTSTVVGGTGFTLTVKAANIFPGAVIRWNGQDLPTTFVDSVTLTAPVDASAIAAAGTANVTVFEPAPGGGESAPLTFTIANPVPTITSLSPASVSAGGMGLDVTVTGTGIIAGSVVNVNGSARTTTYVSATQVKVHLTQADLATAGVYPVTVVNPSPGGGTSNPVNFTVVTVPQIAVSSATVTRVGGNVRVTLTLANNGGVALVNGKIKASTLASQGTLTTLPIVLPTIGAGATSSPVVLDFPGTITAGSKVMYVTVTGDGVNVTVARWLVVP